MNKLDNFREQIENVIAFTVWLGVIGYVVVTFWLNHKMPDFEAPTWNLKIPAETFITPYLLLWAAMERMVANVNPDGWLKGFWQGLDRWRGIGTAIFMVVTLTLAVEKSEVSYLAVLIGIAGYALFDAYDNWSRGMGIASTAGVPIGALPKEVEHRMTVKTVTDHVIVLPDGREEKWDPTKLIEHQPANPT